MADPGTVNRALLEENFQNPGEVYDDTKTEGALEVLADQIDANAVVFGTNGAQHVTVGPITGVLGDNVYAVLAYLEQQILAVQGGAVPSGSITNAMLQDAAVSYAKLDAALKGTIDTANKFRDNNGIPEFYDGTGWVAVGGSLGLTYKNPLYSQLTTTIAALTTWYTAVNITGKGYVDRAVSWRAGNVGSGRWGLMRITIDGVTQLTCRIGGYISSDGTDEYKYVGGIMEARNIQANTYQRNGSGNGDFNEFSWGNVVSSSLPYTAPTPTTYNQSDLFLAPGPMFFNTSLKIEVYAIGDTSSILTNVRGGLI